MEVVFELSPSALAQLKHYDECQICGILFYMENFDGENFLLRRGLIRRPSEQRRQILGCIGCQWFTEAEGEETTAYGYQIMKCTDLRSSTVYPIIGALKRAEIITLEWVEPTERGQRMTHQISPADSPLGQ
jgi:hypothetical protein